MKNAQGNTDQPHARNYPGRGTPKAEKVREASHDAAELKAGKMNSLGMSKDGSHKGLHKNGSTGKHVGGTLGGANMKEARSNSMGKSADGSHKGLSNKDCPA